MVIVENPALMSNTVRWRIPDLVNTEGVRYVRNRLYIVLPFQTLLFCNYVYVGWQYSVFNVGETSMSNVCTSCGSNGGSSGIGKGAISGISSGIGNGAISGSSEISSSAGIIDGDGLSTSRQTEIENAVSLTEIRPHSMSSICSDRIGDGELVACHGWKRCTVKLRSR